MPSDQIARFQTINRWLSRGGAIPTQALAHHCGVSVRTLKEDIATLRLVQDAPIQFDRRQNGYVYTQPFELKLLEVTMTDREVLSLRTAVATLSQFREMDVFVSFRAVVDKIEEALRLRMGRGADAHTYLAFESAPAGRGSELIEPLLEACMRRQPVQFSHRKYTESMPQERVIFPYLVKEHRNRWYVVGFDDYRQEVRVFGLDRIEADSVTMLPDTHPLGTLAPPFDTGTYFRQAMGVAIYSQPPEAVVLSLRPPENHQFKAQPFFPYAPTDVLLDTPDELRVKLTIIVNEELIYELARLGPKVRVISPPELQQRLVTYLTAAIGQYE